MSLSTILHSVEASRLAGCRGSRVCLASFLAFHFAFNSLGRARDLVLVRATVPREHSTDGYVSWVCILFRSVLVGSLRPSVYTIEGGLRTTGCRCCHGYLDFFPKFPEHVVVGIPMQYSRKSSMGNWRSCNFHTLSTATLSTELRRYSKPSTSSPQRSCPGYVAVLRRLCSFTDQVLTQLDVLTNLLRSISCRNGAMRK